MKNFFHYSLFSTCFLSGVLFLCSLVSCNTDEGLGGAYSLEGYVYNIVHYDDNYSFATDTFPAAKKDVYLIFGNNANDYFGDDVETDPKGFYRFEYLRKGTYTVFSYSEYPEGYPGGLREAIPAQVKVNGNKSKADTIFIHSGKAYGTAMIKGHVNVAYYHNGDYKDSGLGTGMHAYIRYINEDAYFDNVRVAEGVFVFQKLFPGEYVVAVETQDKDTESVTFVTRTITITETGKIYDISETYQVNKSV
ncbi:MAG: hypothetical protein LBV31_02515 [Prevotellaceae bacterium]|jgi:hypothetical protein|nr:hypothetical protein [Prevotellaceae bacterium]